MSVCLPHRAAENANDGFKPTCGHIEEISFRSTPEVHCTALHCTALHCTALLPLLLPSCCCGFFGSDALHLPPDPCPALPFTAPHHTAQVWGYFSVKGGGAIHEFSDSQFGHLFAKGETREAAIRAMVVALKEVKIRCAGAGGGSRGEGVGGGPKLCLCCLPSAAALHPCRFSSSGMRLAAALPCPLPLHLPELH